jgi:hypothetical protein
LFDHVKTIMANQASTTKALIGLQQEVKSSTKAVKDMERTLNSHTASTSKALGGLARMLELQNRYLRGEDKELRSPMLITSGALHCMLACRRSRFLAAWWWQHAC